MTFYEYILSYIEDYDYVLNNEKTIIRYCFSLRKLRDNLTHQVLEILNSDIEILAHDRNMLLELELVFHKFHDNLYNSSFFLFEKILSKYIGSEIIRPSVLNYKNNNFHLIELYSINKNLTETLRKRLISILKNLSPKSQKVTFKTIRKTIIQSNKFSNSFSIENLVENILKNKNLNKYEKCGIKKLLLKEKKFILINNVEHNITRLFNLNNSIYNDYQKLNLLLSTEYEYRLIFEFTRYIDNFLDKNPEYEKSISEYGLNALTIKNYEILLKIKYTHSLKIFNKILFIIEKLSNRKIDYKRFDERCFYIQLRTKNTITLHLNKIYKKSPIFAKDYYDFFSNYLNNIKYENSNETTAVTNINTLNFIFITYIDKEALDKYSLNILQAENFYYFRLIKAKINERYRNGEIKITTQFIYFNALKWFCQIKKQKYINDYDTKIMSIKESFSINRMEKCYTEEELSELITCVIKSINLDPKNDSTRLLMYYTLFIMLTGWNLSSVCDLKIDSIRQDEKNKNLYIIDFVKPRANYTTHSYSFFKNTSDKTIYLLLYVRDILRSRILEKRKNIEYETDHLWICLNSKGYALVAHMGYAIQRINAILKKVGCTVLFNTIRMRKTTTNQLYKIVLKKFSHYRELIDHDFNTFVNHYEQFDILESNNKIANGTKILEQYLKSEICLTPPEVKNSEDNVIQFTPLGDCTAQYETAITTRCSDYIACIFCKNFSVVNTESQIHKLLDFQNVCISQMTESSSSYNDNNITKLAINEIKERLDFILNMLKNHDSKLYELAKITYIENRFFSL